MQPENVWDYPRPPRLERVRERVQIDLAGQTIAETGEAYRVLETSHPPVYYLPRASFTCDIVSGKGMSLCEWKGLASYWSLCTGNRIAEHCAWSYETPTPAFNAIKGYLAVYPAAMDACFVDSEAVLSQPGGFYGGWVTSNLTGPFKGGPGTMGW